jgi:hypothetical protein
VFENKVLRIFGQKRDQVRSGWRKLHNEELCDLYSSLSIMRMRRAGHVARIREKRNAYRLVVGKPEGKTAQAVTGFPYGSLGSIPG